MGYCWPVAFALVSLKCEGRKNGLLSTVSMIVTLLR